MANVKQVQITGRVPFDWLSDIDDDKAALLARHCMSPVSGLRITYVWSGLIPNEHGGHTSMYDVGISGSEGLLWNALRVIAEVVKEASDLPIIAQARDVENDGGWVDLIEEAI